MRKRKVRATAYPENVTATVRLDVRVVVSGTRPAVEKFLRVADPLHGTPIEWGLKCLGTTRWDLSDRTLAALGESSGGYGGGEVHILVESFQTSWTDAEVKKA